MTTPEHLDTHGLRGEARAVIPDTVPIDRDILRRVREALAMVSALQPNASPEERGAALGRADGAHIRLELWLRDCLPDQQRKQLEKTR